MLNVRSVSFVVALVAACAAGCTAAPIRGLIEASEDIDGERTTASDAVVAAEDGGEVREVPATELDESVPSAEAARLAAESARAIPPSDVDVMLPPAAAKLRDQRPRAIDAVMASDR